MGGVCWKGNVFIRRASSIDSNRRTFRHAFDVVRWKAAQFVFIGQNHENERQSKCQQRVIHQVKIIVLRCLLDVVRQIVPCVQTNVNPHHRQPEEACDNAELDEITCEVITSPEEGSRSRGENWQSS